MPSQNFPQNCLKKLIQKVKLLKTEITTCMANILTEIQSQYFQYFHYFKKQTIDN